MVTFSFCYTLRGQEFAASSLGDEKRPATNNVVEILASNFRGKTKKKTQPIKRRDCKLLKAAILSRSKFN